MVRIAILLGSTRPGRNGEAVAKWAHAQAQRRSDATFDLIDLADHDLPLLDEPMPPSMGHYTQPHTQAWAARIAPYDGYLFVTPEYNHGVPGALKNAVDYLYKEWNDKAAGFVAYGSAGGVRAVEQWRLVCAELQMATVRAQVMLSLRDDFEEFRTFRPRPFHAGNLDVVLDQLVAWSRALRTVRQPGEAGAARETREERAEHARPGRPAHREAAPSAQPPQATPRPPPKP